ncbi:MAG: hypothetical protein RTU63_11475 [Candidatus Thorarchaeota archaeon]
MISDVKRVWKQRPDLHSRFWILLWISVTSIITIISYSTNSLTRYDEEIQVLVNAMNIISSVLVYGIPIFLLTGIIFGTCIARTNTIELQNDGRSSRKIFLRNLFKVYGLVLLLSVSLSIVFFLEPAITGLRFYDPTGTGFLIYFLPVLLATCVVSLILASFGILLVAITDDIILSTAIGSALTIGVEIIVWWNSTTGLGLRYLSPQYFTRVLAGRLAGYDPPLDYLFRRYFGFTTPLSSILVILTIFGILAFISIPISFKIFRHNSSMWGDKTDRSQEIEEWDSKPVPSKEPSKNKRMMIIRRGALVGLIVCLLIGMTITTDYSTRTLIEQTTYILHESPEGGEEILLGEWYVFSLETAPTPVDIDNYLRYSIDIEDWVNSPDNIEFYYNVVNMSSSEFQSLNETEQRDLLYHRSLERPEGGYMHGIFAAWHDGPYAFAMKAFASDNETLSGRLYCSIELKQTIT